MVSRSVNAYDVSCVEKGPLFRLSITVLQPQPLPLDAPASPGFAERDVLFKPATIKRHFVIRNYLLILPFLYYKVANEHTAT